MNEFLQQINQAHSTIKFTAEWSLDSVTFHDVRAILKDGSIQTDLYSKPTNIQYLDMDSCHPRHCKQAIPYGQALRLRRICPEQQHLKQRTSELKQHLARRTRRGYDPVDVQNQIDKAAEVPRVSALQPSQKNRANRVPLVATYDPRLPRLSEITRSHMHLPVLHVSERLKEAIPEASIIAYRRPRNLRDLLVRAELKPISEDTGPNGNSPCMQQQALQDVPTHQGYRHFPKHCHWPVIHSAYIRHLQDEKSCLPHRVQEVQKTVCRGNRECLTHPPQWS